MTQRQTEDAKIEEGKRRAAEHFASLPPEVQADVLTLKAALAKNMPSLLARLYASPPIKGRQTFYIAPPAPGEECTIPELRKAGLIR